MDQVFEHGYALLIGVDENHVEKWALPDVAKDISALTKILTHPRRCGYLKENVMTLTGQAATRQNIIDALEELETRIRNDSSDNATVILYYSGHGWRDGSHETSEFYLIPYDVRADKIKSRALRSVDFAEAVGELKPTRLCVILDCCHAGGMGIKEIGEVHLPAGYLGAAMSPTLLLDGEQVFAGPSDGTKGLERLTEGKGRAVLSSSTRDQRSYLRKDGQMSIFTYHLIEALTGHARPEEGATEVLVSDLMGHVWRHVPQSARTDWGDAARQVPDYQVSGNFPLALLLGGRGLSKGQSAPHPLDAIGESETELAPGDEITIQSAAGNYIAQAGRGGTASVNIHRPRE